MPLRFLPRARRLPPWATTIAPAVRLTWAKALSDESDQLTLSMARDGKVYIDDVEVAPGELPDRLLAAKGFDAVPQLGNRRDPTNFKDIPAFEKCDEFVGLLGRNGRIAPKDSPWEALRSLSRLRCVAAISALAARTNGTWLPTASSRTV